MSNNGMDQRTAQRPLYWALGSRSKVQFNTRCLFCAPTPILFPQNSAIPLFPSLCSIRADRAGVLDSHLVVAGIRGHEMTSSAGLVPITKSFLSRYYDMYPFPPLSDDVSRLTDQLRELAARLQKEQPLDSGKISLSTWLVWFWLLCDKSYQLKQSDLRYFDFIYLRFSYLWFKI